MKRHLFLFAALLLVSAALSSCEGKEGGGPSRKNEMVFDGNVYSFGKASNYKEQKLCGIYPSGGVECLFEIEVTNGGDRCTLWVNIPPDMSDMLNQTVTLPVAGDWDLSLTGKYAGNSWGYGKEDILTGKIKTNITSIINPEVEIELTFEGGKEFSFYYKGVVKVETI